MDFDEFAAMSRELGELAPLDSAEYKKSLSASGVRLKTEEHVDPNTHMKRVKVMGVSVQGFVARYARKGSLGTDAALLGCGSLDDRIQLISSCQLELDADAAGRVRGGPRGACSDHVYRRIRSWWPLRTFLPRSLHNSAARRYSSGSPSSRSFRRVVSSKGPLPDCRTCWERYRAGLAPVPVTCFMPSTSSEKH